LAQGQYQLIFVFSLNYEREGSKKLKKKVSQFLNFNNITLVITSREMKHGATYSTNGNLSVMGKIILKYILEEMLYEGVD
jgi:hypothetical protein